MAENKRFAKASWAIMAQLLKVDNLEEALSGSLEIIVKTLNSEAGAIWLLDQKTDRLFVYTDGVAEAKNSERQLFGTDRLLGVLNSDQNASPQQVLENVTNGINAFVGDAEQFDDITMLGFAYYGPDEGNTDIS